MSPRFIADNNVGKLARWLRMMGYDTLLARQKDDHAMIAVALHEDRLILTKDTEFVKRRLVTNGRLKAVLVRDDAPKRQIEEVVKALNLDCNFRPFSLCLECNRVLLTRSKEDVCNSVPPHICRTQTQYTECPSCHRIYWRGTHWQAMVRKLQELEERPDGHAADA